MSHSRSSKPCLTTSVSGSADGCVARPAMKLPQPSVLANRRTSWWLQHLATQAPRPRLSRKRQLLVPWLAFVSLNQSLHPHATRFKPHCASALRMAKRVLQRIHTSASVRERGVLPSMSAKQYCVATGPHPSTVPVWRLPSQSPASAATARPMNSGDSELERSSHAAASMTFSVLTSPGYSDTAVTP